MAKETKSKNYPFYRFDKIKWNIVDKVVGIFLLLCRRSYEKNKSFAHSEFNKSQFTNINQINEKINSRKICLEEISNLKLFR